MTPQSAALEPPLNSTDRIASRRAGPILLDILRLLASMVVLCGASAARPPGSGYGLPDSTVIGRVGDRVIRAGDYRERFLAAIEDRPAPDSAGRAAFLNRLADTEVMIQCAIATRRPLDFGERATLREHTNSVLSNALFDRLVADSVTVTDDEVDDIYRDQYGWAYLVRGMVFDDRATAETARQQLLTHRMGWQVAARMYSDASSDSGNGAGAVWISRPEVRGEIAIRTFALQPGEFSPVIQDGEGFHVIQVLDRRQSPPPPLQSMRRFIKSEIRQAKINPRLLSLYEEVRARAHMTYDTSNIRFAVAAFRKQQATWPKRRDGTIEMADRRVHFPSADAGRVLARTRSESFTIGAFTSAFYRLPPRIRPRIQSSEGLRYFLDSVFLEPIRVAIATERGLDQHPESRALIERKREELFVARLYRDSIAARVRITPGMRREYYQAQINTFVSRPKVQYLSLFVNRESAADSLVESLSTTNDYSSFLGTHPERGISLGKARDLIDVAAGVYTKVLFTEMKPGQVRKVGPTPDQTWMVMKLLKYDGERQMPFEEAETLAGQSVRQVEEDLGLSSFLDRRRKDFVIELHPELLSRIELIDPATD